MTPKACALVLVTCLLLASGPTGSTGPTGSEAAEATQGASGVSGSGGTGTCSYDAHHEKLWCSLRTLNAQNNTASIQSSTRARHMNVQCSDVFFYESILRTNHFNYLPNLQSLTLEFCKIRRIPSLAFSGLSGLHELVIRTHNSEWSAMVMELESDAFTGKASNIHLCLRVHLECIPVLDQFLVSGIGKLMKVKNDTKLVLNDSFRMNLVPFRTFRGFHLQST